MVLGLRTLGSAFSTVWSFFRRIPKSEEIKTQEPPPSSNKEEKFMMEQLKKYELMFKDRDRQLG